MPNALVRPLSWLVTASGPLVLAFALFSLRQEFSPFAIALVVLWYEIWDRVVQLKKETPFEDTKG